MGNNETYTWIYGDGKTGGLILPKISVIVPVYNVEKYLGKCVKSILSQSFKDFELLLINDASTDSSLAAAEGLAAGDKRVKVLDKPHGGLGDTRNYGVAHAYGKYILFIDSDDWVEPDMFENLYAAAESFGAEMVVFNFIRENLSDGESRECTLPVNYPEAGRAAHDVMLQKLIGPDGEENAWRHVEMLGCAWRRMYLRSWFVENNIRYGNEQKIMLEDLPAAIKSHCLAEKILLVGGTYYHYRYNPDSLSTRYRPKKMEMLSRCFDCVKGFLTKRNIYDAYRERHLAWFLRYAAHSSLVNCFSPMNEKGFKGRYGEVSGILKNPILREAVKSDYLKKGSKADRIILRVLRSRNALIVYTFYRNYTKMLLKDKKRK